MEQCYHIHFSGIVQGVGFRPFVHKLALKLNVNGWVTNGSDGVHIYCKGNKNTLTYFYEQILHTPPQQAFIAKHSIEASEVYVPDGFYIHESKRGNKVQMMLTPDITLCDDCRRALRDPKNRRFEYPFITCVNCGPRYSIISLVPYDRANTTMQHLKPCSHCQHEYEEVDDIRHHSQTNSCPHCSIPMHIYEASGMKMLVDEKKILNLAVDFLSKGKILAIKGIGGYLLMADAANEKTIALLRKRKHRPSKPFALLYADLEMIKADLSVNAQEMAALKHTSAPIVLCKVKKDSANTLITNQIAPGLDSIGAMLPSSPLLQLIADKFGRPLIATSANVSGSPIIFTDNQAKYWLLLIADYLITYDREIVTPQDDSVLQYSQRGKKIILRRSRGLSPNYFPLPFAPGYKNILALGADLKSTFAILQEKNLFVSQYLGDQQTAESQESYQAALKQISSLLHFKPACLLIDKHPAYQVSHQGKLLATKYNCILEEVQHHEAHFSAVLAENNLFKHTEPVLGFIWDGAGYGNDGHIWGGEIFKYQQGRIERMAHLQDFPQLLGNKMNKEPRISALSLLNDFPEWQIQLEDYFSKQEWVYYHQLSQHPHHLYTSSMGRLIDGVASLLGIKQINSFEGEAALLLETRASKCTVTAFDFYPIPLNNGLLDWHEMILQIMKEKNENKPVEEIARKFFYSLAQLVLEVSNHFKINQLAFSGGVFQNKLLLDMIIELMQHKRELYFHQQLSPNDECISFGQIAYKTGIKKAPHPILQEKEMY